MSKPRVGDILAVKGEPPKSNPFLAIVPIRIDCERELPSEGYTVIGRPRIEALRKLFLGDQCEYTYWDMRTYPTEGRKIVSPDQVNWEGSSIAEHSNAR